MIYALKMSWENISNVERKGIATVRTSPRGIVGLKEK